MLQTELTAEEIKLEKSRTYARERMQAKRAADPEGVRAYQRAWKAANPEKVKAQKIRYESGDRKTYRDSEDYKERRRESRRRWHAKNPDYSKTWKATNPEKVRAWYEANVEKVKFQTKRNALKRIYGLTLEQRDQLFAMQDFRCAICKSTKPRSTKSWHIDHCHSTKRVRGILCSHCNLMLGYAKDNKAALVSAIDYLSKVEQGDVNDKTSA